MKKLLTACIAGTVLSSFALGAVACGPQGDISGGSFSDAELTVKAVSLADKLDISDDLFGIFLEDINFASYVMCSNIVANGNFEQLSDSGTNAHLANWSPSANSRLNLVSEDGVLASNEVYTNDDYDVNVNPNYCRVETTQANAYITNNGYSQVPMSVKKDEKFNFSAFIRTSNAAKMTVSVTDGSTTYATATVDLAADQAWIKYKTTLTASGTCAEKLQLRIAFDTAGTYDIDAVALETQDSTLGIKNYVYEAIRDLSPKFMRFPGGCIIEGDYANGGADTVEVYDWKNSVGAAKTGNQAGDDTIPAFTYKQNENGTVTEEETYGEWVTRTNNYDLWGYNMDYGLGFYEYFLLCDDIGASPIPILNCGLSDLGGAAQGAKGQPLNGRHGKKVQDYIADAKDLIAFANGSVTSSDEHEKQWAQLRVNMGHAEPFGIKYLGIGNEQFGAAYYNLYQQFVDAFKEAAAQNPTLYGDVELIVGNGMVFSDCEGAGTANLANTMAKAYRTQGKIEKISEYGIVDHHYYMGYPDFLHYATEGVCIYDKYSRKEADAYRVFVGEYSANNATRYYSPATKYNFEKNVWKTAISEGAYMTALERNGDIVCLAAYAPMFGAVDGVINQWKEDMMYFTNTQLVRSTNYYVQQLFMKNSGTDSLYDKVEYAKDYVYEVDIDEMTFDRFYTSVVYDEATGDIIVKLVNVSEDAIKANIDLAGASPKGVADATILQPKVTNGKTLGLDSENSLEFSEIEPRTFTIGGIGSVFGYELPAQSITAIRIHTK